MFKTIAILAKWYSEACAWSLKMKQKNSAIDRKPNQVGQWDPVNKNLRFVAQISLEQEHMKVKINPADKPTMFLKEHQPFSNG